MTDRHYRRDRIDPDWRFDRVETTVSHLLREPHPALGGRAYGPALLDGLDAAGFGPGDAGAVWEIGGGAGWLAARCLEARPRLSWWGLDLSRPALGAQRARVPGRGWVRADCRALPLRAGAVGAGGLVLANEVAADLPVEGGRNTGALALVAELGRVLGPGGAAAVVEFGSPESDAAVEAVAMRGDGGIGDHTEWTVRFADLLDAALRIGLVAEVRPLFAVLGADPSVRAASYLDLRRLRALVPDAPVVARDADALRRRHPVLTRLFDFELPPIGSPRWPDPGAKVGAAQAFQVLMVRRPGSEG